MSSGLQSVSNSRLPFVYGGIFFFSAAVIEFEVCLLRLFSVLFVYHFAFAIVSLALLGLGLGAIVGHVIEQNRKRPLPPVDALSYSSNLFAGLLFVFILTLTLSPTINFARCSGFALLPFIVGGMVMSRLFRDFPNHIRHVYCFNLLGSAVGAASVPYILTIFGGITSIALICVLVSLSALMFAMASSSARKLLVPAGFFVLFLGNLLICVRSPYLPDLRIDINPHKEPYGLSVGRHAKFSILETRWSIYGRTDLIDFSDEPFNKSIFTDATAGSCMYSFDGDLANMPPSRRSYFMHSFIGAFPYHFLDAKHKNKVLIIGSGGGKDVLAALLHGVRHITALDVNPDVVDLVKKYRAYNGGIYTDFDNVKVVTEDGRSYVRRNCGAFDLIVLSLAVSNTSRTPDGYALTEDFLYTTEAIQDYLSRLTTDGQLVFILHGRLETYRLVSIVLPVLETTGIGTKQAMDHLYVVQKGEESVLVVSKTPLSKEDMLARNALAHRLRIYESNSNDHGVIFFPLLTNARYDATMNSQAPHLAGSGTTNEAALARSDRMDAGLLVLYGGYFSLANWLHHMHFEARPVTDDRPFVFNLTGNVPDVLKALLWVAGVLAILAIFLPPVMIARRKNTVSRGDQEKKAVMANGVMRSPRSLLADNWRSICLFLALGMGFVMVEVTLIQWFILFLGQPGLSFSVLLAALFTGMGFGGLTASQFSAAGHRRSMAATLVLLIALTGIYDVVLGDVFVAFLGVGLGYKVLLSAGLIIPIGFLLGIPFPTALCGLSRQMNERSIPWMWGLNSVGSVLGSVLAMVIAGQVGFDRVMLTSMAMYAIALVLWLTGRTDADKS